MLRMVLKTSRPRFWLYTAGPFLLGVSGGADTLSFFSSLSFWLLFLFFLLPANIWLYGVNDWFDWETDRRNAKKQGKEHLLTPERKKGLAFFLVLTLVAFILLFFLLSGQSRTWLLLFWLLSTFYSAPPLRLKARPFFDSYSNWLYILPGIIGFSFLTQSLPPLWLIGAGVVWTAAMHAFSAIPDIDADSQAGISTVATLLGRKKALLFCSGNWLVFSILLSVFANPLFLLTIFYALMPLALLFRSSEADSTVYWVYPTLNAVMGFLGFWYLIWLNFR